MRIRALDIFLDKNGFVIIKKGLKYVKLGFKETKYLFESLKIGSDDVNSEFSDVFLAEELNSEEKTFLDMKFAEWGLLKDYLIVEKRKSDLSRIYLFEVNPEKVLGCIPLWIKSFFHFEVF